MEEQVFASSPLLSPPPQKRLCFFIFAGVLLKETGCLTMTVGSTFLLFVAGLLISAYISLTWHLQYHLAKLFSGSPDNATRDELHETRS